MTEFGSVVIIGAGPIGTAMAAVFSCHGWQTTIVDTSAAARENVPAALGQHRQAMLRAGFDRQDGQPVGVAPSFGDLPPAGLVLEAGPERLDIKRKLFEDLIAWSEGKSVLTTMSSAIPVSDIVAEEKSQGMCLVAHPANPPSLLRILELVPAQGTRPETMQAAARMFRSAGFDPVELGREIPAFVFNRLQSALLREAYRLVGDGVIGANDLDRLVRDGLGPRWALSGPFETADLNTAGGIRGHAARLGPAYAAIGREIGEKNCDWPDDLVTKVEDERRILVPEDRLEERRTWRQNALADLLAARRNLLLDWKQ